MTSPESRARSHWTFILNQDAINVINTRRGESDLSPFFARLSHNKLTYFVPEFTKNYLSFLNPYLLFFKGTDHYQFNIPDTGILFSISLPFFYLGLVTLFKLPPKTKKLIILWFLIGLFPAAITSGDFPVIRAASILPIPYILIVLGLKRTPRLISLFVFLILIQFALYWNNYTHNYPKNYSWAWQYGYQESIEFVKENYDQYDEIWFTKKYGEPHEFVLFHWPWDPASYQNDPHKVWDYHANWYWVDAFGKFKFLNDWEIKEKINAENPQNTLLVTSPGNYTGGEHQKTVFSLDSLPVFEIIRYP